MDKKLDIATLGGGCYWCVEAIYENVHGVSSVLSGFSGNPKTEALNIEFDPTEITYTDILNIFFKIHDPTTLNRQGNDVGEKYRSVIFYRNNEQQLVAEKILDKINTEGKYKGKVVTKVEAFEDFSPVRESEQHYFQKNQENPYCQVVISPKVKKFKKQFKDKLKEPGIIGQ